MIIMLLSLFQHTNQVLSHISSFSLLFFFWVFSVNRRPWLFLWFSVVHIYDRFALCKCLVFALSAFFSLARRVWAGEPEVYRPFHTGFSKETKKSIIPECSS